jgi:hypothetical protein
MRACGRSLTVLGLVALGYVLGSTLGFAPNHLKAQNDASILTEETTEKLNASRDAAEAAMAGRGVDPETFAGLYAGLAVDEVASELAHDDEGRLTYKGKLVRMYPISRLKRLFAQRSAASGESETTEETP